MYCKTFYGSHKLSTRIKWIILVDSRTIFALTPFHWRKHLRTSPSFSSLENCCLQFLVPKQKCIYFGILLTNKTKARYYQTNSSEGVFLVRTLSCYSVASPLWETQTKKNIIFGHFSPSKQTDAFSNSIIQLVFITLNAP